LVAIASAAPPSAAPAMAPADPQRKALPFPELLLFGRDEVERLRARVAMVSSFT
jgi:hypothetical protein